MAYTRDADGFAVPLRPNSSAGSVAPSDFTGATGDPLYQDMNLAANNVYMEHPCDPIPEYIASLVDYMYVRQDRESPGPSLDEIRQDRDL